MASAVAEDPIPPITRDQLLVTAGIMAAIASRPWTRPSSARRCRRSSASSAGSPSTRGSSPAYLVTSTTTVPIYAKLADIYGRKPVFLFGLVVFVVGVGRCAASRPRCPRSSLPRPPGPWSRRGPADLVHDRRRHLHAPPAGRMQGLFSGVWGVSAIIGPAIGGIITTTVGWPWVFEINLPVGILAAIIWFASSTSGSSAVPTGSTGRARSCSRVDPAAAVHGVGRRRAVRLDARRRSSRCSSLSVVLLVGFVVAERAAAEPTDRPHLLDSRWSAPVSASGRWPGS